MRDTEALFESLIDGILEKGYGVADAFLLPDEVTALRTRLWERQAAGQFREAGIGNGQAAVEKAIRGDEILWLDTTTATPEEATFLNQIDQFIGYVNRTCYLGLRDSELHYARYPVGTFYKRHLDRFRADSRRRLSIICYLNDNWQPTDGGQLAVYLPQPDGSEHTTLIAPVGGRLVCFDSGLLEHEVLPPANRDRLSITGWLRTA
ncbi:2OG-Fe(II) oxygenase [Fibrivirga algicola]|uniref:2OG-Fe(II) oxygenase n=1 Tax=Fibrivirga algicola TaxID=2950420 RepID=A0ABX0QKH3_9BACT|nr:2OG-Fe(II) oxygenase [Fibrivirga algicola]ARK09924.1 oxidoreductase [Fibrella sp. ES10-3-2-2]NID11640.1 2OG-Fe(II) oxygenase [Fibrivirga algicola]